MTEAHGGLAAWAAAPAVEWVDRWTQPGQPADPPMRVVVEQGRRRAYLERLDGGTRAAWDGERAWGLAWEGAPPRFMALLNYYFLNLPWVVHDPGVRLGEPQRGRLWDDPTEYWTVRMTFEAGVGDTPRDDYLLYLDPESHRLRAVEYVVTYRALLPEGAEATPPHVLVFEDWTMAGGLTVPAAFTIYQLDHTEYGACAIRDWSFSGPFDESRLALPEGGVVDTSTP
ncbi:MAG: hypothetical protein ACRD0X_02745, partial [Thermoanaerobaculia bacterium]